jgi:hypothetical protein
MKPRKKFRSRPKKRGARKRQRILSQKRRLIAAGYDKGLLDKMTIIEIRDLLKKAGRRKVPTPEKVRKAKPKVKPKAKPKAKAEKKIKPKTKARKS